MRTRPLGLPGMRTRTFSSDMAHLVAAAVAAVAALLAVVASGVAISAALPQAASPWLVASSYAAPAAIAFAVYWWIAQRS